MRIRRRMQMYIIIKAFLDDLIDFEFSHYLKHIDIIKILKCIEWCSKSENIDGIVKLYDSI